MVMGWDLDLKVSHLETDLGCERGLARLSERE